MPLTPRPKADQTGKSTLDEAEIQRRIGQGSSEPGETGPSSKRVSVILRLPQSMIDRIEAALDELPVRPSRHAWLMQAIEDKLQQGRPDRTHVPDPS